MENIQGMNMFERLLKYFEKPESAYDKAERLYSGAQKAAENGWTDVVSSNLRQIRLLDIDSSEYTSNEAKLLEKANRRAAFACMGMVYDRCEVLGGKTEKIRMSRVGIGEGLWVGENGKLYVFKDNAYLPNRDFNPDDMLEANAYRVAQLGFDLRMVAAAESHIRQSGLPLKEETELLEMLPKEPATIVDPEPIDVTEDVEPTVSVRFRYKDIVSPKKAVKCNRAPRVKKYLSGGSFVN